MLSATARNVISSAAQACDYHELDIIVVPSGMAGRPNFDSVRIGVECKNVGYTKEMLRALLGVRRELSLLQTPQPTGFTYWPRRMVPASPPSCLLTYSTSLRVQAFAPPGDAFGVDCVFEPIQ
jgi:hypothetical protein